MTYPLTQGYSTSGKAHGQLFVFEGPDGVGKTTVATLVVSKLLSAGHRFVLLAFPGNNENSIGRLVYDLHHKRGQFGIKKISATSLQLLHVAAHVDAIERVIKPALLGGTNVILDRYWWSTMAYGRITGADMTVLHHAIDAEKRSWGIHSPACAFLFKRRATKAASRGLLTAYDDIIAQAHLDHPVEIIQNDYAVEIAIEKVMRSIVRSIPVTSTLLSDDGAKSDVKDVTNSSITKEFKVTARTSQLSRVDFYSRLAPAKPTVAYSLFWRFASERQKVFFRRVEGQPPPWTDDPVILTYRFTNAYRASDRVSQYMIRHALYDGDRNATEVFFRTILFKTFNKISTWQLLKSKLGEISWREYSFKAYNSILDKAFSEGSTLYSAAYIMPSCKSAFKSPRKHTNHLRLIETMIKEHVPDRICDARSMCNVYDILKGYPGIGAFLAYQYCIDINYSALTNFSEMQFVVPGPGASDGIHKCFSDLGGLNEVEIIKYVTDNQEREFEALDVQFKSLWGRKLQLIDCQNLFCELSKYTRVVHPELSGTSGRTTIKQKFRPLNEKIDLWYPPKWGINEMIAEGVVP